MTTHSYMLLQQTCLLRPSAIAFFFLFLFFLLKLISTHTFSHHFSAHLTACICVIKCFGLMVYNLNIYSKKKKILVWLSIFATVIKGIFSLTPLVVAPPGCCRVRLVRQHLHPPGLPPYPHSQEAGGTGQQRRPSRSDNNLIGGLLGQLNLRRKQPS